MNADVRRQKSGVVRQGGRACSRWQRSLANPREIYTDKCRATAIGKWMRERRNQQRKSKQEACRRSPSSQPRYVNLLMFILTRITVQSPERHLAYFLRQTAIPNKCKTSFVRIVE